MGISILYMDLHCHTEKQEENKALAALSKCINDVGEYTDLFRDLISGRFDLLLLRSEDAWSPVRIAHAITQFNILNNTSFYIRPSHLQILVSMFMRCNGKKTLSPVERLLSLGRLETSDIAELDLVEDAELIEFFNIQFITPYNTKMTVEVWIMNYIILRDRQINLSRKLIDKMDAALVSNWFEGSAQCTQTDDRLFMAATIQYTKTKDYNNETHDNL